MNLFEGCTINEDGEVVDPSGCHWDSKLDYVLLELLGFCGCGIPNAAGEWVRDGLRMIDDRFGELPPLRAKGHRDWWDRVNKHFGDNDGAMYFFWYWCDDQDLTEHGGSMPGWLTDKGKAVLAFLEEADLDG